MAGGAERTASGRALPGQAGRDSREARPRRHHADASELESFGLAALEAMACEVVPIATRVGGVPEVIEHGKSGFLADVGDVATMARYAVELLSDKNLLQEMAKASRAVAQSRFCSSKIIPQYEEFYRRVLERSS